jgi:hypothetical protein
MKTRVLSAALATVFGVSIPGSASAQILARPRFAQTQPPPADREIDREPPSEQTERRRAAPPAAQPLDTPGGSGVVMPALPPCPVTMVLVAPFGHDCVVTLSPAPFWFGYAGFPYSRNSYGRRSTRSRLEPSSSVRSSRQREAGFLRPPVEPQTPPEPRPVSYEPYVPGTPGTPKTFYVIPGCYGGDRPPQRTALPKGCDISQLHSY